MNWMPKCWYTICVAVVFSSAVCFVKLRSMWRHGICLLSFRRWWVHALIGREFQSDVTTCMCMELGGEVAT